MAGQGTPATALLARQKVAFGLHPYAHDPRSGSYGTEAAEALGVPPGRLFKTLVVSVDGRLAVAVVPVAGTLDLKAIETILRFFRSSCAAAPESCGFLPAPSLMQQPAVGAALMALALLALYQGLVVGLRRSRGIQASALPAPEGD